MTSEILLNGAYGGFSLSKEAVAKYNEKLREINLEHKDFCERGYDLHPHKYRMEPILINIVKELGDKANGTHCKIYIESFNSEFKNYIKIHEYDGQEDLEIDIQSYRLDLIKEVVNSDLSSDDKISKIKEVLNKTFDY